MVHLAHGSGLRAHDEWFVDLTVLAVVSVLVVLQLVRLGRRPEDVGRPLTEEPDGQHRSTTNEELRRLLDRPAGAGVQVPVMYPSGTSRRRLPVRSPAALRPAVRGP